MLSFDSSKLLNIPPSESLFDIAQLHRRIHDPVPIFNDQMLKPVSNFMDRLAPNKSFYRANWTVRVAAKPNDIDYK